MSTPKERGGEVTVLVAGSHIHLFDTDQRDVIADHAIALIDEGVQAMIMHTISLNQWAHTRTHLASHVVVTDHRPEGRAQ